MPDSQVLLMLVVVAAILFGVTNGANDAANSIATVIGSRNLSPRAALIMAGLCEFAGAATGTAVAKTIGKGIIQPEALTMGLVLAGVTAVIVWSVAATIKGMPVSLTHGLVAGMVGAALAQGTPDIVQWGVLGRVFSAVAIAPLLGFVGGFCVFLSIVWIFRNRRPAMIRVLFSKLEIASAAFLAYSHGKNDGQMPIGLITMGLMVAGGKGEFEIPTWAVLVSATAISLGTVLGGRQVIRTVGMKMTVLNPSSGFAAEASAATIIEMASHLGIPVSTTHCVSSAIMGVGASRRLSAVRWSLAGNIVRTWVLTFPGCALLGFLLGMVMRIMGS
ncbi:MAG: inorganic phosphate transporter [Dehalococcoidia bacterium]|nr:inorganic phosphate transporter [Dehalococcoidia bacterium]